MIFSQFGTKAIIVDAEQDRDGIWISVHTEYDEFREWNLSQCRHENGLHGLMQDIERNTGKKFETP